MKGILMLSNASATLDNPAFAELVLVILSGLLIISVLWEWLKGR